MNLVRENPRRYIFWPEDTSNKPHINMKTIENNAQAKVSDAEDRIWTENDSAEADIEENIFFVPETEARDTDTTLDPIKAEPIFLTPAFDDELDNENQKIDDRVDKEAEIINDTPMKIETFFGQLANKNQVTDDFNTQFSNGGSFVTEFSNTKSTTTSTTATSSTTLSTTTSTTSTSISTSTPRSLTTTTSTSTATLTTSTISTITSTITKTSSTASTTRELGIESFFGQLQEASNSALKSKIISEDTPEDKEEVFLGSRDREAVNSSLSRDDNQHHLAEIIEISTLNISDANLVPDSQIDVKIAENNNMAVNLEEEEIRTTIRDLVEETTVFTITNETTPPIPVVNFTTEPPIVSSEAAAASAASVTTIGSVTTPPTRRLPSRYMNTRQGEHFAQNKMTNCDTFQLL